MKKIPYIFAISMILINYMSAQTISFQGKLNTSSGAPVIGVHNLTFKLVDAFGNYSHFEQTGKFLINNGFFIVNLGDINSGAKSSFPENQITTHQLEISENGTILSKIPLTSDLSIKIEKNNSDKMLGAKIQLSQLDQDNANNNDVVTWSSSDNRWKAVHFSNSGSISGVSSLNDISGSLKIIPGSGLRINSNGSNGFILSVDTTLAPPVVNFEIPIGTIMPFAGDTAALREQGLSDKWKLCDGQAYLITDFPQARFLGKIYGVPNNDPSKFQVPDYRGMFLRGVSYESTNDPDKEERTSMFNNGGNQKNKVGSIQLDIFGSHNHSIEGRSLYSPGGNSACITYDNTNSDHPTLKSGGKETRPKNAYVNYIIKLK